MPIRETPTFDPAQLSFPTGYLGDLLDVNDSGRVHGSILVFNTGYGDSPGTWIIGTGGLATGSLNSLSDVNVDGVSSGQYLVYQGSTIGWTGINSTGGATNLDGLSDVVLSSPTVGDVLLYNGSTWINSPNINSFIPTGLVAGTGATNTEVIANWVNLYGYALIPTGLWYVGTQISITKPGAILFGPGTIRSREGFSQSSILNLGATGVVVADITVHGAGAAASVVGINVQHPNCTLRGVTVTGATSHQINLGANSKFAVVDNCKVYGATGLGDGIELNGPIAHIKDTYLEGWGVKGINASYVANNDSDQAYITIDNCYIKGFTGIVDVGTTNYSNAILVDAGAATPLYDRVTIKDTIVEMSGLAPQQGGFDPVKIARVRQFVMDNSSILMNMSGSTVKGGLRIAEEVRNIKITNSEIRPNIHFETATALQTESFELDNCIIGTPATVASLVRHSGYPGVTGILSLYTRINNCQFLCSGVTPAISISADQVKKFEFTNNYVSGHSASNFSALRYNTGTLFYRSNTIYYNNNTIVNGGIGNIFTATNPSTRTLLTWDGKNKYYANVTSTPSALSSNFEFIRFASGDLVEHTGFFATGTVYQWRAVSGGLGSEPIWQSLILYGSGSFGSGLNYLDELADVNLGGPIYSNQVLFNNGTQWHQSFFDTTNLANTTGHALVSDDHALVYQGNINKYVSVHVATAPTGLLTGTGVNNTTLISNWLNGRGYAYIPSGEYYIWNKINVTKNNAKIFGPGTIKARNNFSDTAIVNLLATGCIIEDVTLDGSLCDPAGGSLILNLGGGYCKARNVTITGTPHHGIAMGGIRTLVEGCRIYGRTGIGSAINASSPHTIIRDTYIENFGRQGIGLDEPRSATEESFALVENCKIVLNASGENGESKAGILVDTGVGSSGYSHVTIRNTDVIYGLNPSITSNVVKFATVDKLTIENCNFYCTVTGAAISAGMRVAEGVNHLTIKNTYISPQLLWENNTLGDRFTDNVYIENCKLGNFTTPFHSGRNAIEDIRANNVFINGCQMKVSGISIGILTDTGIVRMSVTNSIISGYRDGGTFSALFWSSGGTSYFNSKALYWNNNKVLYQGDNAPFTASTPTARFLQTANLAGNTFYANTSTATNAHVANLSQMTQIMFNKGDVVINTGMVRTGEIYSWITISSGVGSGTHIWQPLQYYLVDGPLYQSYLSGIHDVTEHGISNTSLSTGIADALQQLVTALPDNSSLRFPPGKYWLNKTIHFEHKRNIDIIAHGAQFYETPDRIWMNSGAFYFNRCTGITWHGGSISGAATLAYVLSVASGVEMSGLGFENLATDSQLTRNVSPCTFNLEQCSDFLLDSFDVQAKYRYVFSHRGINQKFVNSTVVGVHTGWLNRLDTTIVPVGTGTAQKGDIDKESARQSFMFNIIKGIYTKINNCHSKNCGGLLSAGSNSLGGGQGPSNPEGIVVDNCSALNSYDNGIYLSSANKCRISNTMVICDTGLPHHIDGIKARGAYIVFDNCYVEHVHHAFGFEGIGGNPTASDYWTSFTDPGWSSQGCIITNCHAVDVGTIGIFLDGDEDSGTHPRDALIANNYFYNCYLGPSGRYPTGYISVTESTLDRAAVISASDGYRVKIINNTIENTGAFGPDYAIFAGIIAFPSTYYITGCVIADNTILGCRGGIKLKNLDFARVYNNYAERLGINNYWHTVISGTPALINAENVKNSRFSDNVLAPTGHALLLTVIPGSVWSGNIVRDNFGKVEIN